MVSILSLKADLLIIAWENKIPRKDLETMARCRALLITVQPRCGITPRQACQASHLKALVISVSWAGRADSSLQENNNEASSFIQYECLPSYHRIKGVGWVELIDM